NSSEQNDDILRLASIMEYLYTGGFNTATCCQVVSEMERKMEKVSSKNRMDFFKKMRNRTPAKDLLEHPFFSEDLKPYRSTFRKNEMYPSKPNNFTADENPKAFRGSRERRENRKRK
ncbi:MAG: uncharacterized protein A8A55_3061, partial [Amphiamblys sp. WSBS2006]